MHAKFGSELLAEHSKLFSLHNMQERDARRFMSAAIVKCLLLLATTDDKHIFRCKIPLPGHSLLDLS